MANENELIKGVFKISPYRGSGNGEITVETQSVNTGRKDKTANLTIKHGSLVKNVLLTQSGKQSYLSMEDDTVSFSGDAQTNRQTPIAGESNAKLIRVTVQAPTWRDLINGLVIKAGTNGETEFKLKQNTTDAGTTLCIMDSTNTYCLGDIAVPSNLDSVVESLTLGQYSKHTIVSQGTGVLKSIKYGDDDVAIERLLPINYQGGTTSALPELVLKFGAWAKINNLAANGTDGVIYSADGLKASKNLENYGDPGANGAYNVELVLDIEKSPFENAGAIRTLTLKVEGVTDSLTNVEFVKIRQSALEAKLGVSPTSLTLSTTAGATKTFSITSNTSWEIS